MRTFLEKDAAPFHGHWEKQGYIDRRLWNKAGEAGMLCSHLPEEYGGLGADFLYSAVVIEEISRLGLTGIGFPCIRTLLRRTSCITAVRR